MHLQRKCTVDKMRQFCLMVIMEKLEYRSRREEKDGHVPVKISYRLGMVNPNTVNSKLSLFKSLVCHITIISCLIFTVNSNST